MRHRGIPPHFSASPGRRWSVDAVRAVETPGAPATCLVPPDRRMGVRIIRVLRDIGYARTVSSVHPSAVTERATLDYRLESEKTLGFLRGLREQALAE